MNVKYHMEDMVSKVRDGSVIYLKTKSKKRYDKYVFIFREEYPVPKDIIIGRASVIPPSLWWWQYQRTTAGTASHHHLQTTFTDYH